MKCLLRSGVWKYANESKKLAHKTIIKLPMTDKTELCKQFIHLTHAMNECKWVKSRPFLWISLKYKVEGSTKGGFSLKDIEKRLVERPLSRKKTNVCWRFACGTSTHGVTIDSYPNCLSSTTSFKTSSKSTVLALFFSYLPITRTKSRFPLQSTLSF